MSSRKYLEVAYKSIIKCHNVLNIKQLINGRYMDANEIPTYYLC
jgi:hypothetical protein